VTCIQESSIGDDGARALAGALERNTSVTTLDLRVRRGATWANGLEVTKGLVSDL
jgi:hypothetical protein